MNATPAPAAVVAEMADICADIMARWNASRCAPAPTVAAPKPTREQLQAALAEAEAGFDPLFAFSDDYSFFCEQQAKSERINAIKHELEWAQLADVCPVPAFPSIREAA